MRTSAQKKMQSALLELIEQYKENGNSLVTPDSILAVDFDTQLSYAKIDTSGKVLVYVTPATPDIYHKRLFESADATLIGQLQTALTPFDGRVVDLDTTTTNPRKQYVPFVRAWLPVAKIDSVSGLPIVAHIGLVTEPVVSGLPQNRGSLFTRTDMTAAVWSGQATTPVKVGVISDDCGSRPEPGESTSQLQIAVSPSAGTPVPPPPGRPWIASMSNVTVFDDSWDGYRSHEGLAMMEVVTDIAPQAKLEFATGYGPYDPTAPIGLGMNQLLNAIEELAADNCDVITDDLLYLEEPAFEDGPIASLIDRLTADSVHPIVYTSAAGNWAKDVYSFTYSPVQNETIGVQNGYTFVAPLAQNPRNGDYLSSFSVPTGTTMQVMLQWDDPYLAPTGQNDFDLYLVDVKTNQVVQWSTISQGDVAPDPQNPPFEYFTYTPNGCVGQNGFKLFIVQTKSDPNNQTPRMKLVILGPDDLRFRPREKSLFGHAAALGCIACGALQPEGDFNELDPKSSLGPVEIVATDQPATAGHRPLKDSARIKPDVCAVEGLATSVPTMEDFYGTSSCAPVVAGLAARMMSSSFGHAIAARDAAAAIRMGCVHYGSGPSMSKNNYFGYGRVDMYRSVSQILSRLYHEQHTSGYQTDPTTRAGAGTGIGVASTTLPEIVLPNPLQPNRRVLISLTIEGYVSGSVKPVLIAWDGSRHELSPIPVGPLQNMACTFGSGGAPLSSTAFPSGVPPIPFVGFYAPTVPLMTPPGGLSGNTHWRLELQPSTGSTIGRLKDWGIHIGS